MEILRTSQVQLLWRDGRICARVGFFAKDAPAGVGDTLPEALRDLATTLEQSTVKVWVPRPAKVVVEDGQQKLTCPECGAVHTSGMDNVLAFVCDDCGSGVEVEE
jgi:hypothetical protein